MRPTRLFVLLALAVSAPAWAGLFGNDAPGRIPVPAKEFRARLEDRTGVVTELERVTFDGEVFVFGTVGLAVVTVPFDTLRRLEVGAATDDDHVVVHALTKEGQSWDVVVESDRPVFGRAAFGNYRIEIGQLRTFEPY